MKCNHDVMHLVGTSEGIMCRMCGKTFASFKELEADRSEKAEKVTEEATETEQTAEEKPKKQAAKKKGGK